MTSQRRRSSRKNLSNLERRLGKAKRLLEEGRVELRFNNEDIAVFRVHGDTDEHSVILRAGIWMCDCEFNSIYPQYPCSHILACQMLLEQIEKEKKN
ncbi:MAG: hypothetical protein GXN93_01095 [Candidatus Diapherotrites archaeon]|nr:hypothetical protein [Candidatus Diapherotrites archaeon]